MSLQESTNGKQSNDMNLKWKVLVEIGRSFARHNYRAEKDILDLVCTQTKKVMDTNYLSIVLNDKVSGGSHLVFIDGRHIDANNKPGHLPHWLDQSYLEKILHTNKPIILRTRVEVESAFLESDDNERNRVPAMWISMPMRVEERMIGAFLAYHPTQEDVYDDETIEVLEAISDQAAVALRDLQQAQRKEALIKAAHEITSGIDTPEDKTLDLIYAQASKLMDTKNMYVALYDESSDMVRFPLAFVEGKKIDIKTRKAGKGKTEEIIRTKKPIFQRTKRESEEWYAEGHEEYIDNPLASWVGVPMIVGKGVIGVIATYHPTEDYVYEQDDVDILGALAADAAIALDNARLYSALNEKATTLEKANRHIAETQDVLTRSMIAADFIHRLNNLIATIPLWVNEIRDEVKKDSPKEQDVMYCLDQITGNGEDLLHEVERLKNSEHETTINISLVLAVILDQIRIQYRNEIQAEQLEISDNISPKLSNVFGVQSLLANALFEIVSNGIESILAKGKGKLTIKAEDDVDKSGVESVKIEINDTGKGISKRNMDKIFNPYFTTKPAGEGYGLWRAKYVIEEKFDGDIGVDSQETKQAKFTILLPIRPKKQKTVHILTVDDQENWCRLLKRWLENEGFQVSQATNLKEAEEKLNQIPFDMIVLDVSLKHLEKHNVEGLALLKTVKSSGNPPPSIIILTAYPDKVRNISEAEALIRKAKDGSALERDEFINKVKEVINKRLVNAN